MFLFEAIGVLGSRNDMDIGDGVHACLWLDPDSLWDAGR